MQLIILLTELKMNLDILKPRRCQRLACFDKRLCGIS
jgi:hypothetical protein